MTASLTDGPSCLFCAGRELLAVVEPVQDGTFLICGGCGELQVVRAELVAGEWIPTFGKLKADELAVAKKDPAVRRARNAYRAVVVERGTGVKVEKFKAPGPILGSRPARELRIVGPEA